MVLVDGKYRVKKNSGFWELGELVGDKYNYSFHATMKQACEAIMERELGRCDSIEEVLALLIGAEDVLAKKIEEKLQ